jgi:biotin carboxyl carrier protein
VAAYFSLTPPPVGRYDARGVWPRGGGTRRPLPTAPRALPPRRAALRGGAGRARGGAEIPEEEAVATPVEAPMVGKVLQVLVKVGDEVTEDDTVVVMEAMKMEINVVAPTGGRVAEVRVAAGDSVDTDQVVAVIE